MANSNGWGDGAANNSIGWGQGANNAIAWGDSHAKSWAGATDIVGLTTDPAASAYFTATGITGATQQTAIDNLVKGLKQDGLWSKMKAVYPFATDNRNLIDYSEDFSNALWNKGGATISANSIIAPNGTLTADKLNEDNTNSAHYAALATGKMLTTNTYTVSAYLKAGERIWGAVYLHTGTSPLIAFFNLSNGTIGNTDAGVTATMTDVGNGWYRCTTTAIIIGSSNANGGVLNAQNNGTWIYTGTSGNGIYAWGAQLELGSTATTYQPIATTQQAFISNQFKYNLVNPVDSDAAFRLVFNGGWTHSANGATPNGTNGWANTYLNVNTLAINSIALGYYSRTNTQTQQGHYIDASFNSSNRFGIANFSGVYYCYLSNSSAFSNAPQSNSLGFLQGYRNNTSNVQAYKNSTKIIINGSESISSLPSKNFEIGRNSNLQTGYTNEQCAFAYIGNGLTDTEAANLYTRVQAFQTALSRQV